MRRGAGFRGLWRARLLGIRSCPLRFPRQPAGAAGARFRPRFMGQVTVRLDNTLLKKPSDTTRAGRSLRSLCPTVGSKHTSMKSPHSRIMRPPQRPRRATQLLPHLVAVPADRELLHGHLAVARVIASWCLKGERERRACEIDRHFGDGGFMPSPPHTWFDMRTPWPLPYFTSVVSMALPWRGMYIRVNIAMDCTGYFWKRARTVWFCAAQTVSLGCPCASGCFLGTNIVFAGLQIREAGREVSPVTKKCLNVTFTACVHRCGRLELTILIQL